MRTWRLPRWVWITGILLLALLVIGRLMLPGWVADYANRHLDRMGDYHGSLKSVDIHLWRGAYSINDLRIEKSSNEIRTPFLTAPRIDVSVAWNALLHGAVVADVEFHDPELTFVDAPGKGNGQSGQGVDWRAELEDILPIRLDKVQIHNGRVSFRNFDSTPPVNLEATNVEGTARNLSNARKASERSASFDLTANVLGNAPLTANAEFDPLGSLRDFSFAIRVTGVDLTHANDFLQAYANVDAEKGSGDFVMELTSREGVLDGYAKPLFRDVQIFSWEHDVESQNDNPFRIAWEALAGGIENLFKNQSENQFATRVPIHGSLEDRDISTLDAIAGILRNAFVEAFSPTFEKLPVKVD